MKEAIFLLRLGLAFAFLYAGIASFLNPANWIGFFPFWLRNIISDNLLLSSHSLAEVILAVWLISGRWLFYSASVAALAVLSIIVFNLNSFDIVFRDITIFCAALALIILSKHGKFSK